MVSDSTIARLLERENAARPRRKTAILSEDLKTDEKEIAEHMMLVDLGRNDLGRVSDYGSVKVEDLMRVDAILTCSIWIRVCDRVCVMVWIASMRWLRVFRRER